MSKIRLRDREQRVRQLRREGFKLGGAFGSGGDFVFFANEPVAIGLDGAGAEASGNQVGGFAIKREAAAVHGSENGAAIPFAHADVLFVHRKADDVEAARAQLTEKSKLLRREVHGKNRIARARSGLQKTRAAGPEVLSFPKMLRMLGRVSIIACLARFPRGVVCADDGTHHTIDAAVSRREKRASGGAAAISPWAISTNCFYEDAVLASRVLQITLTSRNKEKGESSADVRRSLPCSGKLYRAADSRRAQGGHLRADGRAGAGKEAGAAAKWCAC